jgi:hypothetical protein
MQANPNKFQVLAVGKKTYEKHPTINIQNFELTCEDSARLLGIEIDYQLNLETHISTICRKASQQLNIIKHLGPYLNRLNKLTIFHTFILSNFNFCPLVWHFCVEKNSKKIEKVQERALRFVYEDYNSSYDNLLKKAKVPSLQIRRMRTMALETFKIMNKLSPSCLHNLCIYKIQNIILDTTIYWIFHRSEHQSMAKKLLNLLLLHCGTASQTISGLKTVFLNLRA